MEEMEHFCGPIKNAEKLRRAHSTARSLCAYDIFGETLTKMLRSKGSTHSDVWSAASDNDHAFIQRWTRKLREHQRGGLTRKRRGLEYGRAIVGSEDTTASQTRQYDAKNTGTCSCPNNAQRRLQDGPRFVVAGRPGDGGGAGSMPKSVDEPEAWSGWTPLMCAAANGHGVIVEELLAAGASPIFPSRDKARVTAAHVAAQNGRSKILQRLVAIAPKVMYRRTSDEDGARTPLHKAAETDRLKLVKWMLTSDPSDDHRLVSVISEDDEYSYSERITDMLAEHRKTHSDQKFVLKAKQMRANLGF